MIKAKSTRSSTNNYNEVQRNCEILLDRYDEVIKNQHKSKSTEIFADATFSLHKWHSNIRKLESPSKVDGEDMETFGKQQLGIPNAGHGSILGLSGKKGYHLG